MQNNQDLCLRVGNLELSPCDRTIRPARPLNQCEEEEEDDASTIRLKRQSSDPTLETGEPSGTAMEKFTFEHDLRQSKVYTRAARRKSLESLQSSAAPSFGWSCLSDMSLAQVSDISVISLPLAASELANAIHYPCTSTIPRQALVGHTPPGKDTVIIEPRHHFYERRSNPELASVKEIVILGQQVFLIALHGDDYVMVYEMFLN